MGGEKLLEEEEDMFILFPGSPIRPHTEAAVLAVPAEHWALCLARLDSVFLVIRYACIHMYM